MAMPIDLACDTDRARRVPGRLALLVCIGVFIALAGRLCYLARPFDSDSATFIYEGRVISEGGRFGHEVVDNKFPTVGLLMSVPWRAFGADWPAYVLLGTAMSLLGCAMLARAAGRAFGAHAVVPGMLFALVYLNFSFAVFGGFQLETIECFFSILAGAAALNWLRDRDWRDAFVVGLAGGCAAMAKPTGLAVVAAFVITIASDGLRRGCLARADQDALCAGETPAPRRMFALFAMLCGLLLPASTALTYLIRSDTLREMPALARQIAAYGASSAWQSIDWLKPATIILLGGFPLVTRFWVFRKPRERVIAPIDRSAARFVFVWLVLESMAVFMQRRMYAYHFLVLAPPLTLLFAMIPRRVRVAPIFAALGPAAMLSLLGALFVISRGGTPNATLQTSNYLLAHTQSGDAIWKDDAARLWLETNRAPATRVPLTFLFANTDDSPQIYSAQMLADFTRTRPKYLVLPANRKWVDYAANNIAELQEFPVRRENYRRAWQSIFDYVDRGYARETTLGGDAIYRRNDRVK